jgi:hypothetical protein
MNKAEGVRGVEATWILDSELCVDMGVLVLGVENPNACWVVNKTRRMVHILCIDELESLDMIIFTPIFALVSAPD